LVGYEELKHELAGLGVSVVAGSADAEDKAREVAEEVSFPIAYGVGRDIADALGSWWEPKSGIIHPSEFIVGEDGKVVHSSYSSGPLGRTLAADVISLLKLMSKYR
jgi:peroxiredoxin